MSNLRLLVATVGMAFTMSAAAETFVSGKAQVHLIELYTSEGCSSCPPADRWLGALESNPHLWSSFVPVAFHVDYWNYLGWRDDYARAEFTDRQQRYARLGQVNTVYTPGMMLDGMEWRDWYGAKGLELPEGVGVGELTLQFDRAHSSVKFVPAAPTKKAPAKAYLALLGNRIESPIKAGENAGKRLRHDFVVLDLVSAKLQRTPEGSVAKLPGINTELTAPTYAVAAWITTGDDSRPLQVVGGWLK